MIETIRWACAFTAVAAAAVSVARADKGGLGFWASVAATWGLLFTAWVIA